MNLTYIPQEFATISCCERLKNITQECSAFQLNVAQTYNNRLEGAIIVMIILIFYQIYIYNQKPKFTENEIYQKYIHSKIELAIMMLALCILFIIYMM